MFEGISCSASYLIFIPQNQHILVCDLYYDLDIWLNQHDVLNM